MRNTLAMTVVGLALSATAALAQNPTTPVTQPAAPTATAPQQTGPLKIAYINAQAVMANAPGAAQARSTIEAETNKHRADLALADDSIKTMISSYAQKQLAMSKEVRDKQEADIRSRQQALQDRADALEQQMQKREQDLLKPIMDQINTVLSEIRKERGYALILDTSTGAVVAADPALDLTNEVLNRLKAATTPAATGPKKP